MALFFFVFFAWLTIPFSRAPLTNKGILGIPFPSQPLPPPYHLRSRTYWCQEKGGGGRTSRFLEYPNLYIHNEEDKNAFVISMEEVVLRHPILPSPAHPVVVELFGQRPCRVNARRKLEWVRKVSKRLSLSLKPQF